MTKLIAIILAGLCVTITALGYGSGTGAYGSVDVSGPVNVASNALSGNGTIFAGYNSPNVMSNNAQVKLWNTTASFVSGVPPALVSAGSLMKNTNLMIAADNTCVYTNMGNGGAGVLFSQINYSNGNFRAVSTVTLTTNFPAGGYFMVGVSTNLAGGGAAARVGLQYASTNQNRCFGLMATNSGSAQWFQWFNYSSGVSDWQLEGYPCGTNFVTPGTYVFNLGMDASNLWITAVYPGGSNVMKATIPITSVVASGVNITNMVMGLWGSTNCGNLIGSGWRYGSQTISNATGIEGNGNYAAFSQDAHVCVGSTRGGDQILIITGAQYDSVTNPAKGFFCVGHGNGGDYNALLSTNVAQDAFTNDNMPRDYFNQMLSNNYAIGAYYGDQTQAGRIDTWATTNSYKCVDALMDYAKAHISFNLRIADGESAGGMTMAGYCGTHPGAFDCLIMNHAGFSILNQWNGGQTNDINNAFSGTTVSQFTSQDPVNLPANAFLGLPVMCISSTGDTVVDKTLHTDLLVKEMGGAVGVDSIGTVGLFSPEVYDYVVAGAPGVHGGQCYTPAAAAATLAFLNRCQSYTAMRRWSYQPGYQQPNITPLVTVTNPITSGGYWTNITPQGSLTIDISATALTGNTAITNYGNGEWHRISNFVGQTSITMRIAPNDYVLVTNTTGSDTVDASWFRP